MSIVRPAPEFKLPLTTRESEVCDLICRGFSNKEAAIKLGIGARTVEDHRLRVMKKYRVENVVQLVRRVYKLDEIAAHQPTQRAGEIAAQ